ncbi:MAG: nicotinate-nicotinamide nucleotide adenylyltransferase, partial [Thermoguttaceae bacterium]|nr:nicotinate-nicotinamide nucleotide adenylyltransferase [Thermoguttaceae bacterium]
ISYTIRTVRHYQALYPEASLFLIVGSETLADIPRWHETQQLCQLVSVIVAWRSGMPKPDFQPFEHWVSKAVLDQWKSQIIPMPKIELAATEIRRRVAAGKSIRFRVSSVVEEYIARNKLYQNN